MSFFIPYLLKLVGVSAFVTAGYWLFLRNNRIHQYNRVFLLAGFLLSLTVPLIPVTGIYLSDTELKSAVSFASNSPGEIWIIAGAGLVSLALVIGVVMEIRQLFRLRNVCGYQKMEGVHFIVTDHPKAPFSFLNNLFWRSDLSTENDPGEKIMRHELVHIRQKHGYEIIFSQLIVSIFWMNPFFRIMQQELRLLHEFIADEASVPMGDSETFARLLLSAHNDGRWLQTANGFFQSSIKRRLGMILKPHGPSCSNLRKLIILPLVVCMLLLFSASPAPKQPDFGSPLTKQRAEKLAAEKAMRLLN